MKGTARISLVPAMLLALVACSSSPHRAARRPGNAQRYAQRHDSSPRIDGIDFSTIPEPIPKALPKSRYGNRSPYSVNGHTYHVLPTAAGYDQRGIASYYASKFNGYKTSDLETYDMYKFTAASKVLPLPSFARVTNLVTGKHVIVRVNDRGPFVPNRIIDLSLAAAVRLGIWRKGTGLVEVEGIDPAHPQKTPKPAVAVAAQPTRTPRLYVQVGAFANPDNATQLARRLRRLNLGSVRVVQARIHGQTLQRVQLGPLPDAHAVDRTTAQLDALGLPHASVRIQ
jgi:rare lipoprotein A